MSFTIPSGIFQKYYDVVDELIDNEYIGSTCVLYFPKINVECSNCYFDSINHKSSNKYKTGGPISFDFGICPYCHGVGLIDDVETKDINARLYWNPHDWKKITNIVSPNASILMIGYQTDLSHLIRADYIKIHKNTDIKQLYQCVLEGQPHPHGFKKDRYYWTYLKIIS